MHDDSTPKPRYSVPRPRMDFRHVWKYNDYRIKGEVAYLLLRDGAGQPCGEFMIDRIDLDRVRERAYWSAFRPNKFKPTLVYVRGMMRGLDAPPGKRKPAILLHRFIMGEPIDAFVDHLNGDALDCRRENLRITDALGNNLNQYGHRRVRELETILQSLLDCTHRGPCSCRQRARAALGEGA